ncbi:MAG: ribose 5-phosphate isomerase B [Elusimicrobia bacterium]|nr:ribose 5-phosphate isomerase B [Elusimicrobiota bacterium]
MRIALGADHGGFPAKDALARRLTRAGHAVVDFGTDSEASTDYPDYARAVGRAVARDRVDRGVLICGTGIGMSIAANKVPGVRAAVVWNDKTAALAAEHNGANVLCLGGRVHSKAAIARMVAVWLATPFGEGRHARRLRKIARMEKGGDR